MLRDVVGGPTHSRTLFLAMMTTKKGTPGFYANGASLSWPLGRPELRFLEKVSEKRFVTPQRKKLKIPIAIKDMIYYNLLCLIYLSSLETIWDVVNKVHPM